MNVMRAWRVAGAVLGVSVLLAGCRSREIVTIPVPPLPAARKDYARQLPPGAPALRKITDPARLPDFRPGFQPNSAALLAAIDHSLRYFTYPSSRKYYPLQDITHERAAQSVRAFRDLLTTAQSADEFHRRVVAAFDVYMSVGCDDEGTVLFTGYYTPIFDARPIADSEYRYPLYRLPPDLVKDEEGECLGRRTPDGSVVPYYTRGEIEAGALKGQELVYLKDRFEAYICTVQGSAKLRYADGSLHSVGYQGNNGKPYTSIGRILVDEKLVLPEDLSLSGLIAFFGSHPEMMDKYLSRNERYVFFQDTAAEPTGSLGLPVTPYASLATDKRIFPRAAVVFLDTLLPQPSPSGARQEPYRRFALDQDTGGAIQAPGRADVYVGVGDEAGRLAGHTMSEGRLYYLFLKEGAPQ